MQDHQLTQSRSPKKTSKVTQLIKIKYSQACLLKKQVNASIQKLTATVAGLGATNVARTRLEVVHMSCDIT